MLESAPAGQLRGWQRYYESEPFGESWRQTSAAIAAICNEIRAVSAGFAKGGGEVEFYEIDDFIPGARDKQDTEELDAKLAAAAKIEGFGV